LCCRIPLAILLFLQQLGAHSGYDRNLVLTI
jgi:hypothetical protein